MLHAGDGGFVAKNILEEFEFGAAETGTGFGCLGDGAMILRHQPGAVLFLATFGHIAIYAPEVGEALDPLADTAALAQSSAIAQQLLLFAGGKD